MEVSKASMTKLIAGLSVTSFVSAVFYAGIMYAQLVQVKSDVIDLQKDRTSVATLSVQVLNLREAITDLKEEIKSLRQDRSHRLQGTVQ